jgi:hypothetical protein
MARIQNVIPLWCRELKLQHRERKRPSPHVITVTARFVPLLDLPKHPHERDPEADDHSQKQ